MIEERTYDSGLLGECCVYDDIYKNVDLSNYKVTYYNFFYVIDATK